MWKNTWNPKNKCQFRFRWVTIFFYFFLIYRENKMKDGDHCGKVRYSFAAEMGRIKWNGDTKVSETQSINVGGKRNGKLRREFSRQSTVALDLGKMKKLNIDISHGWNDEEFASLVLRFEENKSRRRTMERLKKRSWYGLFVCRAKVSATRRFAQSAPAIPYWEASVDCPVRGN